ncbi:hypothetical protein BJF90_11020 [Pseudonocardia sp. CNS-004]|nr:hypothetical protein BJF90_11020 [Pseudonocardia sp. CNS-004]
MMTAQTPARAGLVVATLGVLVCAVALAVVWSIPPEPPQLVRQEAAAETPADPANPCTRQAPEAPAAPEPTDVQARFDPAQNAVVLTAGVGVTLPALAQAVGNPDLVREESPGVWLLGADLVVPVNTSVRIAAPATRWLKLLSTAGRYASVKAFGGSIDVTGTCITSWDPAASAVDLEPADGRGYLLARDGAR